MAWVEDRKKSSLHIPKHTHSYKRNTNPYTHTLYILKSKWNQVFWLHHTVTTETWLQKRYCVRNPERWAVQTSVRLHCNAARLSKPLFLEVKPKMRLPDMLVTIHHGKGNVSSHTITWLFMFLALSDFVHAFPDCSNYLSEYNIITNEYYGQMNWQNSWVIMKHDYLLNPYVQLSNPELNLCLNLPQL